MQKLFNWFYRSGLFKNKYVYSFYLQTISMNKDVNYNKMIKGRLDASDSALEAQGCPFSIFRDNQFLRDYLMLTKQWRLKGKNRLQFY